MSKHTPGPWRTVSNPNYHSGRKFIVWTSKGPGYGAVAEVSPHGWPNSEEERQQKEFDAHLISAAPDLEDESIKNVELLIELRDKHLTGCAAVIRALVQKRIEATQAAIKKAKGEA